MWLLVDEEKMMLMMMMMVMKAIDRFCQHLPVLHCHIAGVTQWSDHLINRGYDQLLIIRRSMS